VGKGSDEKGDNRKLPWRKKGVSSDTKPGISEPKNPLEGLAFEIKRSKEKVDILKKRGWEVADRHKIKMRMPTCSREDGGKNGERGPKCEKKDTAVHT